jgi:hypothetical protein
MVFYLECWYSTLFWMFKNFLRLLNI